MVRQPKPSGRKLPDKGKAPGRPPTKTRELLPRFLIVCEGEKTEVNYFRSFFRRFRINGEVTGEGQSNLSLIKRAGRLQEEANRQGKDYTNIWVVFDFDDCPLENFNSAIEQAQQAGFGVAYSNESFELWYVLHFDYLNCAVPQKQYEDTLSQKLGQPYDKTDNTLYGRLLSRQTTAIQNAERLLASYQPHHNPARDNPCTTVHLLVQELNRYLH